MIHHKRSLTLDVYDYSGHKVCPLYDSLASIEDQATDVFISTERNGWKELTFTLPGDGFRAKYIKADYKIRAEDENEVDWYFITSCKVGHDGRKKTITVTAGHVSQILKTKNLGLEFSDDYGNNIGTAEELLITVLAGTDWNPGVVDTFYEKDGVTVKRRTLKASAKTGSFKLITMICDLFEAKPVFHGDSKTVDIIPMNPFSLKTNAELYPAVQAYADGNVLELHYGTNVSNVTRQQDTQNVVTKLNVRGAYGDDVSKYCGLEECNHAEHVFTLTSDLSAGSEYHFVVADDSGVNIHRSFTPDEDVEAGTILVWSCLDPASMMYIWNKSTERAYRIYDSAAGSQLPADYEKTDVLNLFSFIMDFTYYNESGLISDTMLQNIAKLQQLGREHLQIIQDATTAFTESWQQLTETVGSINFVKLDIASIGTEQIDGNSYTKLTLTDERVQYRTDFDATTPFKWRIANAIKDNGDAINNEAAVIYVIHNTTPVTYNKYYLKRIDDIDDPSELVLWAGANSVSSTDSCYLFETNGVNGLLGAMEIGEEALMQSIESATTKATVKHPVFFSKTAPEITTQSSSIGLPVPEWLDYDKNYAWWYKYSDTTEGELYFCYYADGDREWKRTYVSKTQPIAASGNYWYNWTASALYRFGDGEWIKLDRSDDKAIVALFGTVYYSCRKRDKVYQGYYQKYTLSGSMDPNNWYMQSEYGDVWAFSTQTAASKFVYDTKDGFLTLTPQDTSKAEESEAVQVKRFDGVGYHSDNIFSDVAFEQGSISTETGGDIDTSSGGQSLGYRTSSANIHPALTYAVSGIIGSVTAYFYTLKHDYLSCTTLTAPGNFTTPANTRFVRLASQTRLNDVVCHIPQYETAILIKDETYYLAGTPVGSGTLKGLYPLIENFKTYADTTYAVNYTAVEASQEAYDTFLNELTESLGDLYKEGWWQDDNYVDGDEERLYSDAIDNIKEVAKPATTYTISFIDRRCEDIDAIEDGAVRWPEFDSNSAAHLVDPELDIDCWAYIDKVRKCYDKPWQTQITINTNLTTASQHSFTDVMTNIANVAKTVKAKESIYDRASYISGSGKLTTERLEGAIDAARLQIFGGSSTWYTDDKGNMVFESADGTAAMTLTGNGFAISNTKDKYGDWVWRTFGTGDGFSADEIVTGTLSASLIEAGSITTDHISSTFGETLDLSSNTAITMKVAEAKEELEGEIAGIQSEVTQTNDKIEWAITGDGQTSAFAFTMDALTYVGGNVDLSINNGFNIAIGGVREAAQSAIDAINNDIEPTVDNINAWMSFGPEGLRQGREGSPYSTLIDNEGYHIDKSTLIGQHVASFTAEGIKTGGIHIGNLRVRPTPAGGWAWTEA